MELLGWPGFFRTEIKIKYWHVSVDRADAARLRLARSFYLLAFVQRIQLFSDIVEICSTVATI